MLPRVVEISHCTLQKLFAHSSIQLYVYLRSGQTDIHANQCVLFAEKKEKQKEKKKKKKKKQKQKKKKQKKTLGSSVGSDMI